MPENYEESISLTLRTSSSKKPSRTRVRSWKHQSLLLCRVKLWKFVGMLARNCRCRWLPLCLARQARRVSMGRPVVNPMRSNQNLRAFWKPVNPQDCVWKNLYRIIMRTILQEKGTNHCNITIWYTNLFLCLKQKRSLLGLCAGAVAVQMTLLSQTTGLLQDLHTSDGGRCCGGWRLQSLLLKVQRAGTGRRPPGNPPWRTSPPPKIRQKSLKSFTLPNPWNLAKLVNDNPGITIRLHRSETNGIAEKAVRRIERRNFRCAVAISLGWQNGGLIPWNVTVFCETFKTSYRMGKHFMKGDLENHSKDQWFSLVRWWNIISILKENSQDSTSLVRKCYLKNS